MFPCDVQIGVELSGKNIHILCLIDFTTIYVHQQLYEVNLQLLLVMIEIQHNQLVATTVGKEEKRSR